MLLVLEPVAQLSGSGLSSRQPMEWAGVAISLLGVLDPEDVTSISPSVWPTDTYGEDKSSRGALGQQVYSRRKVLLGHGRSRDDLRPRRCRLENLGRGFRLNLIRLGPGVSAEQ